MKDLNEAAEPALARLANGDWSPLSDQEYFAVAAWITMFVMTFEFLDRKTQVTPFSEREFLKKTLTPPRNWRIWIAEASDDFHALESIHHEAIGLYPPGYSGPSVPNIKSTTFAFGKLLIHAISSRADFDVDVAEYGESLSLQPFWPFPDTPIRKPDSPHTVEEAEFVGRALLNIIREVFTHP